MIVLVVGECRTVDACISGVKGRYDPGYGSTSRMLSETGIALLAMPHPGGDLDAGGLARRRPWQSGWKTMPKSRSGWKIDVRSFG